MPLILAPALVSCRPIAATFAVNTTADTIDASPGDGACADAGGLCSLRAAVMESNATAGIDSIDLAIGVTYALTRSGGEDAGLTGDLDVVGDGIDLHGNGSTVDGGGLDRVLDLATTSGVEIFDLAVTGGSADAGGGIRVGTGGLTLQRTSVFGNQATAGAGGVDQTSSASGQILAYDSTISGNSGGSAGGLQVVDAVLRNTTVSSNAASGGAGGIASNGALAITFGTVTANGGGGIAVTAGTATVAASAIVDQTAGPACTGSVTSLGYNIDSDGSCAFGAVGDATAAPELGPLADNGGPTATHLPPIFVSGGEFGFDWSPVIDRVPLGELGCGVELTVDQRGIARAQQGDGNPAIGCDIGAVEVVPPAVHITTDPATVITAVIGNEDHVEYPLAADGGIVTPMGLPPGWWQWSITGGTPPPGIGVSSDGVVNGAPATNAGGSYQFTVTVTNPFGQSDSVDLSVDVLRWTGAIITMSHTTGCSFDLCYDLTFDESLTVYDDGSGDVGISHNWDITETTFGGTDPDTSIDYYCSERTTWQRTLAESFGPGEGQFLLNPVGGDTTLRGQATFGPAMGFTIPMRVVRSGDPRWCVNSTEITELGPLGSLMIAPDGALPGSPTTSWAGASFAYTRPGGFGATMSWDLEVQPSVPSA